MYRHPSIGYCNHLNKTILASHFRSVFLHTCWNIIEVSVYHSWLTLQVWSCPWTKSRFAVQHAMNDATGLRWASERLLLKDSSCNAGSLGGVKVFFWLIKTITYGSRVYVIYIYTLLIFIDNVQYKSIYILNVCNYIDVYITLYNVYKKLRLPQSNSHFFFVPESKLILTDGVSHCCLKRPSWKPQNAAWGAHLDESGKHYMTVRDQQMVAIHPSSLPWMHVDVDVGDLESEVDMCWYGMTWYVYTKKAIVYIHHGQVLSFVASRFLQHKPEWARALNGCCGRNMHQPWIVLPFTFRSFTMRPWSQIGTHDCWQKIVSLLELPEGYGGYV